MLKSLSVKYKVTLLPALAALSYVVLLGLTQWLGARNTELLERIQNGYAPSLELSRDLDELLAQLQRALQDAVQAEDIEGLQRADALRDGFVGKIAQARTLSVMDARRADQISQAFGAYYQVARRTSEHMLRKSAGSDLTSSLEEMTSRYNAVRDLLSGFTARDKADMQSAFDSARALQRFSMRVTAAVILVVLAIFGALAFWLVRAIVSPLGALTHAASQIAEHGDLKQTIEVRTRDELGTLAASFNEMVVRLRTIPAVISGSVEELRQAVMGLGQLTEAQSANVTQQSTELNQASAATVEIKQVSDVAVERAKSMLQVADRAEALGTDAQAAIVGSIQGLESIREQVQAIVGQISALSEQMIQVGEITERVKELADRSSILALNASIEAARAKEEGRGFAVVAGEMRTLADQSVQSAGRIKSILMEIQRSLRSAVQVSEAGATKVEEGIEQIRASGASLQGITSMVAESSSAARAIVSSVGDQNSGIGHITEVIVRLSKTMEGTLEGIQSAEASTRSLRQTSEALRDVVQGFKV